MTGGARRWLLDTNILSQTIRRPTEALARHLQQVSQNEPDSLCTSVVVECELAFGVARLGDTPQARALSGKIETLLSFVPPCVLDAGVAAHYATIRAVLQRQGTPIGPNDLLIAAHALALDCTLVSDNETEFRRVPGLRVENWLRPPLPTTLPLPN